MAQSSSGTGGSSSSTPTNIPQTEVLYVAVQREGKQVSAKWGLHPSVKEDLKPEEWKELTDIMGKVTNLVGSRFSKILNKADEDIGGNA